MAGDAGLDLVEHRDRRADLPGRAIAALVAVVLDEGRLHRMQVLRRAQAFDGGDLVALVHHRQRQAGIDAAPVDDHRAGAALAVVAALLGAGQVQVLAQRVEQRGARVEFQFAGLTVYFEGDLRQNHRLSFISDGLGRQGLRFFGDRSHQRGSHRRTSGQ